MSVNTAIILAAVIGASGAVVASIAGFVASVRTAHISAVATTETTRLMLEAEHQQRLWEQRAKIYVDAIAHIDHRAMARDSALRAYRLDEQSETALKQVIDSYKAPDRFEFMARLRAFASDAVYEAFEKTAQSDIAVVQKNNIWRVSEKGQEALKAWREIGKALEEAADADLTVADRIRFELQDQPRP